MKSWPGVRARGLYNFITPFRYVYVCLRFHNLSIYARKIQEKLLSISHYSLVCSSPISFGHYVIVVQYLPGNRIIIIIEIELHSATDRMDRQNRLRMSTHMWEKKRIRSTTSRTYIFIHSDSIESDNVIATVHASLLYSSVYPAK